MMNVKRNLTIAVDFDGTLSCNATWPNIGQPNQNLKALGTPITYQWD